jgi:putative phosphoesterase
MRVAVLSDTHDRLPEAVCSRIRTADEIWHLGDVCSPVIVATLETLAPVRMVRGNCDEEPNWPLTLDFTLEDIRFHLEHIPTSHPPPCDIFLHGHTHVARDEMFKSVRFLNPGCISRPKGTPPSFAWLTIEKGKLRWKVMPV